MREVCWQSTGVQLVEVDKLNEVKELRRSAVEGVVELTTDVDLKRRLKHLNLHCVRGQWPVDSVSIDNIHLEVLPTPFLST